MFRMHATSVSVSARAMAVALGMALTALLLWMYVLQRERETLAIRWQALSSAQAHATEARAPDESVLHLASASMSSLGTTEQRIEGLMRVAAADGLVLRSLTIQHEGAGSRRVARVEWHATGSYTALRQWQQAAQQRDPYAALQKLHLQPNGRDSGDGRLEVRMSWLLYLADGPPQWLPAVASRPAMTVAARDPFLPVSRPVAVAPLPMSALPVVLPAPVVPVVPAPELVFVGRLRGLGGGPVVLGRWSDGSLVSLREGESAGQGYRVERLTAAEAELVNTSTQAAIRLALPPEPAFEIR